MKVGIIGTGGMGNVHARHYANMEGVMVSAWDRDADKLGAFCKHHGAEKAESFEHLLAHADYIDICLPTPLHLEFVIQSLEYGLPTLVEKPMARRLSECQKMIDAAERTGAQLGVGHVVRFFPEFELVHNLVQQGKVGTAAGVRMRRGGRAPMGSEGWFRDAEQSGGVILDLAIHDFDWLRWTFGECTQVYAKSVRLGNTVEGAKFEGDYALTTLTFECGVIAHVETTWMDPSGFRAVLEVSGSEGVIEFDSRHAPAVRTHMDSGSTAGSFMDNQGDPYYKHLSQVVEAVRTGEPMPISGADGMAAVAIAEAAIQSAVEGRAVDPRNLLVLN
ncbi:MAG: Gfo/Idh/MocA family oxidoreductase [Fimbriimonadaceae bacterium]|nr:MAG: Gfo/Idh/MocA family oxidoreductase [Fimbriimonadaceae bacterium]